MEIENELVPSLRESLFDPSFNLMAEYAELGIDTVINNEVIKEIPIVNTLSAIFQLGHNVHERNLLHQTLAFICEFRDGTISSESLYEYRKELETNPKKAEKELGRVIVLLGHHVEQLQSKTLASFYRAFVRGSISWEKFCELSEVNRRMFVSDYSVLMEAAKNNGIDLEERELYQVDRLISLGLLQNRNRLGNMSWGTFQEASSKHRDIIVTSLGKTFYQHMPR